MRFADPGFYTPSRKLVPVVPEVEPRVVLPDLSPFHADPFERALHEHFVHYLRRVTHSRMDIKVLSAIQYAAASVRHGDALTAKTLIDLGLRAPRESFPQSFLDFVDRSLARKGVLPATSVVDLVNHWSRIGNS